MMIDLDGSASPEAIDAVEHEDIHAWAKGQLPPASAEAFADWFHQEIGDWENPDVSVRDVFQGGYDEWTAIEDASS